MSIFVNISHVNATISLGNLLCTSTLSVNIFCCDSMKFNSFVPISFYPFSGYQGKYPGSLFFTASLQVFIHISKIPYKPLLLQDELSQLPQPLHIQHMLQSLIHLHVSLSDSLQYLEQTQLPYHHNWTRYTALFNNQGWAAAPLPAVLYWKTTSHLLWHFLMIPLLDA